MVSDMHTELITVDSTVQIDQPSSNSSDTCGSNDAASKRTLEKRKAKLQKALASEFVESMAEPLKDVEAAVGKGSSMERSAAKQRRLAMKEVLKTISNPAMSVEDRLRLLQAQYVKEVAAHNTAELHAAAVTAQLEVRTQEKEAADKEVLQQRSKVEDMKRLSASWQAQQEERYNTTLKALQEHVERQSQLLAVQAEDREQLLAKNQEMVETVKSTLDLASNTKDACDRLVAQRDEVHRQHVAKLQEGLESVTAQLQKQDHLQKLLAEAQESLSNHGALIKKYQDSEERATRLQVQLEQALNSNKELLKLQQQMTGKYNKLMKQYSEAAETATNMHQAMQGVRQELESQKLLLPTLLQDRKDKQQLQEELARTTTANERLQGLCRALQARIQAGSSTVAHLDLAEGAIAGAGAAGVSDAALEQPAVASSSSQADVAPAIAAGVPEGTSPAAKQPAAQVDGSPEEPAAAAAAAAADSTGASVPSAVLGQDVDEGSSDEAGAPCVPGSAAGQSAEVMRAAGAGAGQAVQESMEQAWQEVSSLGRQQHNEGGSAPVACSAAVNAASEVAGAEVDAAGQQQWEVVLPNSL